MLSLHVLNQNLGDLTWFNVDLKCHNYHSIRCTLVAYVGSDINVFSGRPVLIFVNYDNYRYKHLLCSYCSFHNFSCGCVFGYYIYFLLCSSSVLISLVNCVSTLIKKKHIVLLHFYGMVMYLAFFQERSILHERWPVAGPVDEVLVKSSCYIMEVAHSFRLWLKNLTQPKKSTKGTSNVSAAAKPTHATIWVGKKFPPWQATVLMTMKQLYDVSYALC